MQKEKLTFTSEEAAEIYYALDTKRSFGMYGNDAEVIKWKADLKSIMEKIGVDGINLIQGGK
jgi:hypothetical protein